MKALATVIDTAWANALGWAIIHSLWQSLLIFLLCQVMFRLFARNSSQRYVIATASLMAMFMAAIGTFIYLFASRGTDLSITLLLLQTTAAYTAHDVAGAPSLLDNIRANISILTVFWIAGAMVFSLRLVGSWWYVSRIQRRATVVGASLIAHLNVLIKKMNITQQVLLASSADVHAPVVIGWIKPTILVPIGFLSGLSSEQIETILVHELMHIKRHDYVINLIQSWVECILFFNPFVWLISSTIRIEREHCCDDAVVATSNAKVYALTLAQLEHRRSSSAGMAVGLAENKHQLLNRIKRIMEKSVRNYSGKEKMIPVVLLIIGLACASWVTIQPQDKPSSTSSVMTQPADTTGKKKAPTPAVKHVITVNAEGEVIEETVETTDAEMAIDLEPLPPIAPVQPVPDFDFDMPSMPMLPAAVFSWNDSVPPFAFAGGNWEEFSAAFEGKFKEQFGDFYAKHQKDFDKMMKELETKFKAEDWEHNMAFAFEADKLREQARAVAVQAESAARHQEALAQHATVMEAHGKEMEIRSREHAARARELEKAGKAMEAKAKEFEKELAKELVSDGYIDKTEAIKNIHWHNGELKVNDIKIKEEHKKKYNAIHDKYFKDGDNVHYVH
ncbi:M56 family metallopeptidase [Pseudochryseolinea flava]|uniref:Peptidase M56 domain-containing protein n=1 Tax=Pseudochryseolinea flava TaxID=2059302 RepID=A0A364XYI4_9BACT|nr:M56 family metallopeptidase [Pseudochryseolinea flava]RAV99381.1 hypothetical protein DQQ10_19345 [Pseudochryseolinea flava]